MTDSELLQRYVRDQSEEALGELIRRNLAMVHATALREVRDQHLAEDVTQTVFLVLVHRAKSLSPQVVVSGWLFKTTLYAAADARKLASRRAHHEREARRMELTDETPEAAPQYAEAHAAMNTAIGQLTNSDRNAVVLRYLQGRSTGEVALALGTSEVNARKRVSRALERLRAMLARRGILLAAAALVGLLDAMKSYAAPAGLGGQIESVALGKSLPSDMSRTLFEGVLRMMRNARMKKTAMVAALLAAVVLAVSVPLASSQTPGAPAARAAGPVGAANSAPVATPPAQATLVAQATPPAAPVAATPAAGTPADPAVVKALTAANNRFALEFFREIFPKPDENGFLSPYSVSTALAMTWAGARGNTAAQMARVLHFSELKEQEITRGFNGLQQAMAQAQTRTGAQLAIANSLWPEQDPETPLLPAYVGQVQNDFASGLIPVDFKNHFEEARLQINAWVADKTKDKIKDILHSGDVNADTRLALVNAIYFKGSWSSPFQERQNVNGQFHLAGGATKPVVLMHNELSGTDVGYADFPDDPTPFQMISIHYLGNGDPDNAADVGPAPGRAVARGPQRIPGGLSFVVLLPKSADGLPGLEKAMTAEKILACFGKLGSGSVEVFLPKFHLEQRFDLRDNLVPMGIIDAFDNHAADFSGMTGNRDLHIGKVIHQTFIDVDEKGTEAAAATAVLMQFGGAPRPAAKPPVFRADHPFLFMIRENTTGSILFLGRLAEPTGK